MIDDECEAVGGMTIGRRNRGTRRKVPQCHFVDHKSHMTWARTQAAAVGSRRLTAWAVTRPNKAVAEPQKVSGFESTVFLRGGSVLTWILLSGSRLSDCVCVYCTHLGYPYWLHRQWEVTVCNIRRIYDIRVYSGSELKILRPACPALLLDSCLAYSLTLKMEAICSSETNSS
jgi:hypothetical protein